MAKIKSKQSRKLNDQVITDPISESDDDFENLIVDDSDDIGVDHHQKKKKKKKSKVSILILRIQFLSLSLHK
jgi:hypothetical protein